jgi:undecaprenyl-diphosphatase
MMSGSKPGRSRWRTVPPGTWLALVAAAVLLIGAGVLVGVQLPADPLVEAPDGLDARLYEAAQEARTPTLDRVMGIVSFLAGYTVITAVSIGAILVWGFREGRWGRVQVLLAGAIGVGLISQTAKYVVGRPRPPAADLLAVDGAAFPSGHSMQVVVVWGLVLLIVVGLEARGSRRLLAILVLVVVSVAVGVSRVYLGAHWPSDVLGGWVLGTAWLAAVGILVARKLLLPWAGTRGPRRPRGAGSGREGATGE